MQSVVPQQILTDEVAFTVMNLYMKTMNEVDLCLIDEIIDPSFVLRTPFSPHACVGVDAFKALVQGTARSFSDFCAAVQEVNVKGDTIWARCTMRGTHSGILDGLEPTGRSFALSGVAITRVVDGKIVEDQTFWNLLDYYLPLGYRLEPPG